MKLTLNLMNPNVPPNPPIQVPTYQIIQQGRYPMKRRYGFWKFIGDIFMCVITGGLWLIWIFCREMRNR